MMIVIPVIIAVAAAGTAAAVLAPRGPDFGALGSAHVHAVFEVLLDGQAVDFSQQKYQVQSQFIHVEGGDGITLHRHSSMVPVGEFFKSVNMDIRDGCFVLDNGEQFCDDGKQLRFFVNGTERASINDYILQDNDRILLIYGDEDQNELQAAFDRLNNTTIKK